MVGAWLGPPAAGKASWSCSRLFFTITVMGPPAAFSPRTHLAREVPLPAASPSPRLAREFPLSSSSPSPRLARDFPLPASSPSPRLARDFPLSASPPNPQLARDLSLPASSPSPRLARDFPLSASSPSPRLAREVPLLVAVDHEMVVVSSSKSMCGMRPVDRTNTPDCAIDRPRSQPAWPPVGRVVSLPAGRGQLIEQKLLAVQLIDPIHSLRGPQLAVQ